MTGSGVTSLSATLTRRALFRARQTTSLCRAARTDLCERGQRGGASIAVAVPRVGPSTSRRILIFTKRGLSSNMYDSLLTGASVSLPGVTAPSASLTLRRARRGRCACPAVEEACSHAPL